MEIAHTILTSTHPPWVTVCTQARVVRPPIPHTNLSRHLSHGHDYHVSRQQQSFPLHVSRRAVIPRQRTVHISTRNLPPLAQSPLGCSLLCLVIYDLLNCSPYMYIPLYSAATTPIDVTLRHTATSIQVIKLAAGLYLLTSLTSMLSSPLSHYTYFSNCYFFVIVFTCISLYPSPNSIVFQHCMSVIKLVTHLWHSQCFLLNCSYLTSQIQI